MSNAPDGGGSLRRHPVRKRDGRGSNSGPAPTGQYSRAHWLPRSDLPKPTAAFS